MTLGISLILGLVLTGNLSSGEKTRAFTPQPISIEAQTGDLLFRKGRGLVSQAVLWADTAGVYSHVGIVVERDSLTWVVHAIPGSSLDEGYVRADPIRMFLAPSRASAWALYRPRVTLEDKEAKHLETLAFDHVRQRTPFDTNFDMTDSTSVYCTELVIDLYHAIGRRIDIHPRTLRFMTKTQDVFMPGDLMSNQAFSKSQQMPAPQSF